MAGGSIDASGTTGGEVELTASRELSLGGSIMARGAGGLSTEQAGGSVRLSADSVTVEATASIDASGETGGGEVLVGGGWQGMDASISNARTTDVAQGASIKANALTAGDGGTVVVWSDGTTTFHGGIEARGGAEGGDGGQVEVSGKQHLLMRGTADLRAPKGRAGHLLLDPGTVSVCDDATSGCAASGTDTFTDAQIQAQLGMGSVTIATSAASSGTENINIGSGVSIIWSANTLSLNAGNSIDLGSGSFIASGTASLSLSFADVLSLGGATLSGSVSATGRSGGKRALDFTGTPSALAVVLSGVRDADGFSGSVTGGATISFSGITELIGSAMSDSITGLDAAFTWELGIISDSYSSSDVRLFFSSFENLISGTARDTFLINRAYVGTIDGGMGNDIFWLTPLGSVEGSITGGAGADAFRLVGGTVNGNLIGGPGDDTLNLGGVSNALTVTLSSRDVANGFNGDVSGSLELSFAGINVLVGGSGADTLVGLNAASTWNASSYTDGTSSLAFSAVENISGNAMADVLNLSATVTALTISLGGAPDAGGFDGSISAGTKNVIDFSNMDTIIGGRAASDALVGLNMDGVWTLGMTDSYAVGSHVLTFSALEDMHGGRMADSFVVNRTHLADITGGDGADVFTPELRA